jgi:hypothetical protein
VPGIGTLLLALALILAESRNFELISDANGLEIKDSLLSEYVNILRWPDSEVIE